ncbi:MAG: hypothetical protein WA421_13810 [Nitrososphaeraceae archaeon]
MKSKLETTNYQQQETFDLETKRKIQESLQEIYNKQQEQKQATNGNANSVKGRYIKFVHDSEQKRLSFTGRFNKEQVPYKDFITNQVTEGRYSERYFFECYDITDQNHPSETSTWERGPKDAKTILYWLSNDKNVLDVIRHGLPGIKTTTYDIHPPPKA